LTILPDALADGVLVKLKTQTNQANQTY